LFPLLRSSDAAILKYDAYDEPDEKRNAAVASNDGGARRR